MLKKHLYLVYLPRSHTVGDQRNYVITYSLNVKYILSCIILSQR